ncbi:Retrotransposon gag domain [Arabidopsis suecica]|uniref:Retrotransposon gag domain n=1 Tax=Arabidopsis suecica TaxID=45249 RepID=A0A8T2AEI2_ARASU|nr:Retrotransposon gag domain [Arabidopsis suecica]
MPNRMTRSSKEKNLVNLSTLDMGKLERTNRKAQKPSTMVRGEIRADEEGVLRDDDGQAYNEAGQRLDDQGIVIPEKLIVDDPNIHNHAVPPNAVAAHVDGVAQHHQGVARHQPPADVQIRVGQHGQQQPPVAAARQLTLGDYNMPDLFYANRSSISIKIAFLNNFYDDGKSEELRNKLSTFTQGPAEAFKAAWVRFKEYQRDCPHHGFSEVQLIDTFFRGIDWRYQMAASNGNFNTRYPVDAVALIENLACSNSTKNADFERKKIAGAITSTQFAEVNAKLDSVHSLLTGKKAVHFAAEVETIEPEEESEEGVFYIDGQGYRKFGPPQSNFSGQRFTGNQTNSSFNNSKMETMLEQILEGQTKLTVEFNGKFDAIYSDLNGKIDTLNTHMKKLDVQVAQTAAAVKRQDGVLPGMPDANPKRTCNAILVRDGDDVWQELDTEDELELAAAEPVSSATRWCRSTPVRFPLKTTFDEDSSIDTTPLASIPALSVDRHHQVSIDTNHQSSQFRRLTESCRPLQFPPPRHQPVYTPPVPFPRKRRSKQEIQDAHCKAIMEKILTSIPKVNPETSSPILDRYVKRLVHNGICAEEAALLTKDISLIMLQEAKKERKKKVVVSEHVSSIIQSRMPEKLPDPGSFVLDCSISTSRFKKSLCDLGSSINLMPHSVDVRLGMTSYRPTRITLLLADRSKRIPEGILEDVPVKIGDCLILADFVVLDYDVEPKDPLILGRAFFATTGAKIDMKKGHISLDVCDVKMNFDMKGPRTPPILSDKSFSVDSTKDSAQESQSTMPSELENAQLAILPPTDGPVSIDTLDDQKHRFQHKLLLGLQTLPQVREQFLSHTEHLAHAFHALISSGQETTNADAFTTFLGHEHTSTAYTPPWLARRRAFEKSSNTSPDPPHS